MLLLDVVFKDNNLKYNNISLKIASQNRIFLRKRPLPVNLLRNCHLSRREVAIHYCHSVDRREEESRWHKVEVYEILRFALNDNTKYGKIYV